MDRAPFCTDESGTKVWDVVPFLALLLEECVVGQARVARMELAFYYTPMNFRCKAYMLRWIIRTPWLGMSNSWLYRLCCSFLKN